MVTGAVLAGLGSIGLVWALSGVMGTSTRFAPLGTGTIAGYVTEGLAPEALSGASGGVIVHSVSPEIKIKAFRQEFLLLLQGGTPSADAASVLLELSRKHPGGWETGHLLQVFISVLPVNASNNHKEIALFGLSRIGRSEVLFLGPLGGPAPEICKRRFQEGPSGMFTLGVSQE